MRGCNLYWNYNSTWLFFPAYQESNPPFPRGTFQSPKCPKNSQLIPELLKTLKRGKVQSTASFQNFPRRYENEEQHFIHQQEQSEMLTSFDDKQPVDLTFNEEVGNGWFHWCCSWNLANYICRLICFIPHYIRVRVNFVITNYLHSSNA